MSVGLLLGDHDGLSRPAGLFSFAARSRHTIVHVPLRDGVPPDEGFGELVDLVLVHHAFGLRTSAWPGLRRKRARGPGCSSAPTRRAPRGTPPPGASAGTAPTSRTCCGRPCARVPAFLLGSRDVFAETATRFAHAAGQGPCHKHVAKGHSTLLGQVPALVQPSDGGHPLDVLVCFKAYPPYAHFRRP
ncbi:hypothetical protein [Streptomyces broussonetiae]|uniref:hypothetical protein n=1 Tax=Streptomyces broussonetiae TaxID=2686304 RepID=UPI0035D84913